MKTRLLMKSGLLAAVMVGAAMPATAAYEGDLYNVLQSRTEATARGAMGPIRSEEGMSVKVPGKFEGDMYESFRLPPQDLRGALGPVRTTTAPSAEDEAWKDVQERAPILGGGNG